MAAGISRWASALDGLVSDLFADRQYMSIVERDVRDGQHRNPTDKDYFTTAYFHRPEELRGEVEQAGLRVEGVYGVEGPGLNRNRLFLDAVRTCCLWLIRLQGSQPD